MGLSPWLILAVLFVARSSMGFQHQSIASGAPALQDGLGIGWDQIGLLMGAYFMAGMALAPPAGVLGARFGSRAVTLAGLALMMLGGLAPAFSTAWPVHLVGRIVAGTGGVLITVVMTKMVADWFAGRNIATAMGIFVNAWPVGLAVALLAIPPFGQAAGLPGVMLPGVAYAALGFALIALVYRDPPAQAGAPAAPAQEWPDRPAFILTLLAAAVWGWFNAGFSMVFGFGPAMLAADGMTPLAAGSTVSLALWCTILSVPAGGYFADRFGIPRATIVAAAILTGLSIMLASTTAYPAVAFAVLGLVVGLPAGPIMALPTRVLALDQRAKGMGVFYAVYYLIMVIAPIVAGWLATRTGSARLAFQSGALFMALALASFGAYLVYLKRSGR